MDLINKTSADFLLIEGQTLQEIFEIDETTNPQDIAKANPTRYQVTFETIHDNAERTQNGTMPQTLPTILNRKSKIEVTWRKLKIEWLAKLFNVLGLVYPNNSAFSSTQNITVTYRDMGGDMRTINTYVGPNIQATYVIDVSDQDYWDDIRLAFIEK